MTAPRSLPAATVFAATATALSLALALAGASAQAQTAAKPAASAAASAAAPSGPVDPEKQVLIDRLLKVWHPEIAVVRMIQQYGENAFNQSRVALEQARLPKEKVEADLKGILPDVQKYMDDSRPLIEASTRKNTSPAVSATLASQFTVEELRQLVSFYESPVTAKFGKLQPQLERAVGERVQADIGPQVNKNIEELTKAVGTKLRADMTVH